MDKYNAVFATVMTIILIAAFIFVPYWAAVAAGDLGSQTLSVWSVPAAGAHFATWVIGWIYLLMCVAAVFVVCIGIFLVVGLWMYFYNG